MITNVKNSNRKTQAVIIIPAKDKESANKFCGELVEYGENTFGVALSSDGKEPITHYGCSWMMTSEQFAAIDKQFSGVYTGKTFQDVLAEQGLMPMQTESEGV